MVTERRGLMNSRQWNLMIRMINEGDSREEAEKVFSKEDMRIFDNMTAQLAELRKENPNAAFSPVESE